MNASEESPAHDDAQDAPWTFDPARLRWDLTHLREMFVYLEHGQLRSLTDAEFAKRSGITPQTVSLLMKGRSANLTMTNLAGICAPFEGMVPPSYFFSDAVRLRVNERLSARRDELRRRRDEA